MAAATEATIRAAVKTRLEAVIGIGRVHDYERWASDWSKYLDLFKTTIGNTEQIRGWTIACESFGNKQEAYQLHRKNYEFVIRGYLGLDDSAATGRTAIALAEDVIEELEQYVKLDGALEVGTYAAGGLPRLAVLQPRMYGSVLCHYIEIRLAVWDKGVVSYQDHP